jgi:hypothetical protein
MRRRDIALIVALRLYQGIAVVALGGWRRDTPCVQPPMRAR